MMATGGSGDGPANNGPGSRYPWFLVLATATMAAVLLVAMAAAVSPLNFAATACSADHISLFSVYYFSLVNAKFENKSSHPFTSHFFSAPPPAAFACLFAVANAEIPVRSAELKKHQHSTSSKNSSGAPANSAVLH